ncbi:MAG: hypothetical protein P4K80_09960 [Acidobacteriaceae bacterium]|nr:hypothetical protein [Acidobacteriaceae bacterium]
MRLFRSRLEGFGCTGIDLRLNLRRRFALTLTGIALLTFSASIHAQNATTQAAPQIKGVQATPDSLPHPITDNSYSAAFSQILKTTHQTGRPLHLRYELKMVDVNGKKHSGSYETWDSVDGQRTEIHTDTYNEVAVTPAKDTRWVLRDSVVPLRIIEFNTVRLYPLFAFGSFQGALTSLKAKKNSGLQVMCGENRFAMICFDQSTGFISAGSTNHELVLYGNWRKVGNGYLAGAVHLQYDSNLLIEATLTIASNNTVPPNLFAIPNGAIKEKFEPSFGQINPVHKILIPGFPSSLPRASEESGNANVKIWVDGHGDVSKVELEDADSRAMGRFALDSARSMTFAPYQENGKPESFVVSLASSTMIFTPPNSTNTVPASPPSFSPDPTSIVPSTRPGW